MEGYLNKKDELESNKAVHDWGSITWLVSGEIGNSTELTAGKVNIKKGYSNPRHAHYNCEEILYLLEGKLRHTIGDKEVVMDSGDVITVKPGIMHSAESIGKEDAVMIVAYSSAKRDFVKE